ncbi:MAG: glycosyltransferase [Gemmatimonadota bacterium]|nr:glycosyltransferase [Gemmatimonadota bacterium]
MLHALLWAIYGVITAVLAANLWHLAHGRRRSTQSFAGRVSILVPARNEERNLQRLLPSLLRQQNVDFDVLIYDDQSEDGTFAVASGTGDPRVRVLQGDPPPPGWVGKVHALYQGSRLARGDVLLFLDADTAFTDDLALARIVGRFAALPTGSVLTAIPRFRGGGGLLVSVVPYALLTSLPLPLTMRRPSPRFSALNGQCWMISRELYHAHEPHRAHPAEVLEDVRIGRFLAARGVVSHFADFQPELEVWMYDGFADAWRGFRKNAFLLMGGAVLPFAAFYGGSLLIFIIGPLLSPWFLGAVLLTKFLSDRFTRFPVWISLLAPVSFVLWSLLQLDSAGAHLRGRVMWKGRDVALLGRHPAG